LSNKDFNHRVRCGLTTARNSLVQEQRGTGILFSDMANQGWTVDYETLEMGSLGH